MWEIPRYQEHWEEPLELTSDESEEEYDTEEEEFGEEVKEVSKENRISNLLKEVKPEGVDVDELNKGFAHFVLREKQQIIDKEQVKKKDTITSKKANFNGG